MLQHRMLARLVDDRDYTPYRLGLKTMFEPKRGSRENFNNYIGARVTDTEEAWLRAEMKRRKLTMSDLIRLALGQLKGKA